MKHKTFFWFFLPTGLAMFLFIALPIVSVVIQSVYAPHEAVIIEVDPDQPRVESAPDTAEPTQFASESPSSESGSGTCWQVSLLK